MYSSSRNRFIEYESEYFDEISDDKSYYINLESNFRIGQDDHCPIPDDFDSGNDFEELMKIV